MKWKQERKSNYNGRRVERFILNEGGDAIMEHFYIVLQDTEWKRFDSKKDAIDFAARNSREFQAILEVCDIIEPNFP